MSASAIYEGTARPRRFAERSHEFRYRLALAYVDLGELPSLPLLRGRLVRVERSDYLGDPRVPLDEAGRPLVEERTRARPRGPGPPPPPPRPLRPRFQPVGLLQH